MKPMIILALTIACALPTPAAAESSSCGMAVLQDVDVSTTLVPQASITTARNRRAKPGAVQDWWAYSTPGARLSKRYLVTVRLNDMVYTAEASGDGFWTYDPSTLVINDAIHACVDKNQLRLTRPDGKDYSIKIVRAVRDQVELVETASR
jgi:hypothetical protein